MKVFESLDLAEKAKLFIAYANKRNVLRLSF